MHLDTAREIGLVGLNLVAERQSGHLTSAEVAAGKSAAQKDDGETKSSCCGAEGLNLGKLLSRVDDKLSKATLREKSHGEGLKIATTCDY